MVDHPIRRFVQTAASPQAGGGFNAYAAGNKHYGGGRLSPNVGKTGAEGKAGYGQRDAKAAARRDALIRRAGGTNGS